MSDYHVQKYIFSLQIENNIAVLVENCDIQ